MLAHENPFRASNIDSLPNSFGQKPLKFYVSRLEPLNRRAAIIGEHGVGKSTLLVALYEHYQQSGCPVLLLRGCGLDGKYSLRSYKKHLKLVLTAVLYRKSIIFFDGIDSLPAHLKWIIGILSFLFVGLIVTSHSTEYLPTLVELRALPEILASRISELAVVPLESTLPLARELLKQHQNNYRQVFLGLFTIAATCRNHSELQHRLIERTPRFPY